MLALARTSRAAARPLVRALSAARVEPAAAIAELRTPGWAETTDGRAAINKEYLFKDFVTAWSFMSMAALSAEKADHHPEWSNVYGRVEVTLTTHDAGGVTEKDLALARLMDEYAERLQR